MRSGSFSTSPPATSYKVDSDTPPLVPRTHGCSIPRLPLSLPLPPPQAQEAAPPLPCSARVPAGSPSPAHSPSARCAGGSVSTEHPGSEEAVGGGRELSAVKTDGTGGISAGHHGGGEGAATAEKCQEVIEQLITISMYSEVVLYLLILFQLVCER